MIGEMKKIGIACILGCLLTSCGEEEKSGKIGFMENARVFEGFEMKKDYDKRIEEDMSNEVKVLDSIEVKLDQMVATGDSMKVFQLRKQYYLIEQRYRQKFDENSTRYTQEVNDRLNDYIKKYSEENGYDFVFGSNGQGNVMYAKEQCNISDDLIKYINSEYGKK